ncbi:hypothetical protein I546_2780 [Mycobacterium kansasii 732]|nr:hypothetical protein I546_2780 [Mycobacterium kansasii 732]
MAFCHGYGLVNSATTLLNQHQIVGFAERNKTQINHGLYDDDVSLTPDPNR